MKNSKVINVQGCTLMTRRPCRHGGRGDKTITSFHKNSILKNSKGNLQQGRCKLPSTSRRFIDKKYVTILQYYHGLGSVI